MFYRFYSRDLGTDKKYIKSHTKKFLLNFFLQMYNWDAGTELKAL